MKMLIFLIILIILSGFTQDSIINEEWVRFITADSAEDASSYIEVDHSGNVYLLNQSYSLKTRYDYLLTKYSPEGDLKWSFRYDSTAHDRPFSLAIDLNDNIIITGVVDEPFCTIKLNSEGHVIWKDNYPVQGSVISNPQVVTDDLNNIYVSGNGGDNITTIKYSPSGKVLWTNVYESGGNASPHGIILDKSCSLYIITSGLIKIDSAGNHQWFRKVMDDDSIGGIARSIALDKSNNIYLTGDIIPKDSDYEDIFTIKFSSDGEILWNNKYNGLANFVDIGHVVSVDDAGSVYVTGESFGYNFEDITLIKYDSCGTEMWIRYYDGPDHESDIGFGIQIDDQNNIYVTGASSDSIYNRDIVTLKYNGNGNLIWKAIYSKNSDTDDFQSTRKSISLDSFGNVYVVGTSRKKWDWAILSLIKYKQIITGIYSTDSQIPSQIELYQNYPNPFNNQTLIPFSISQSAFVLLKLYNVNGKMIRTLYKGSIQPGNHTITFNSKSYSSGIYFYTLLVKTNNRVFKRSRKLLVLK